MSNGTTASMMPLIPPSVNIVMKPEREQHRRSQVDHASP